MRIYTKFVLKKVKKIKLYFFFFLVILPGFIPISVRSQDQSFNHLTTRDGLPSGYIWEIAQDQKGFIWIGTNAGLSRYDGYKFTNYRPQAEFSSSISGQSIRSIVEVSPEMFLIGNNAALDIFYPARGIFKKLNVPDSLPGLQDVVSIEILEAGDIWVAAEHGIYEIFPQNLDRDTLEARFYGITPDTLDTRSFRFNTMAYDGDHTLWIGSDSYLHKFDMESRSFIDIGPFDKPVEKVLNGSIWDSHYATNGTLILTSSSGLVVWKAGGEKPSVVTELGPYNYEELSMASFQSVTEDQDGCVWLGTGLMGAIKWNLEDGDVITYRYDPADERSINSDDVHYAFVDDQGNTWFGYHNLGISLMWANTWKYKFQLAINKFDRDQPENDLRNIAEDEAGNLWFTTPAGLVLHPVNGALSEIYRPGPGIPDENGIDGISLIDDQILLLSGNGNRIYRFDIEAKNFSVIAELDNLQLLPFPAAETDSMLYFSSFNGILLSMDKSSYETSEIVVPHDESKNALRRPVLIHKDAEGNYLAFLVYFQPGNLSADSYIIDPSSRSFKKTETLFPENSANIAAPHASAYQPGIFYTRLNSGIFRMNVLTGESGLLFQSDIGVINEGTGLMVEDDDGFLWMNNQTGIMKLDPLTESITNFETSQDNRPANQVWPTQLANGDILFLGKGGYIRFDPNDLDPENPVQKIFINDIMAGQKQNHATYDSTGFELESSESSLAFTYLGLNYRDPFNTRYRYRIEGYDRRWNEVGTQRSLFLANLPPGKYTFEVQAAPRFGAFSDQSASVSFTILPPWWQTLPAYMLYGLIFIGGIFIFDRVQRKRLVRKERERAREKELEQAREIEKAYTELKSTQSQLIQSEKMASLGELTAGIAHEIQNPLNFVNNFSEVNAELIDELSAEKAKSQDERDAALEAEILNDISQNTQKIQYHGKRASDIVKGMLQHSRLSTGEKEPTDINALVDEYLRLAYHGLRAKDKSFNAGFKAELDEDLPRIKVIPQDIGRVLLNLINNAFYAVDKRAKQQKDGYMPEVLVKTEKIENGIKIRIKDNGIGIPEHIRDKIFQPFFTTKPSGEGTGLGLGISYEIISKGHNGSLNVESEEGAGTEFIIELP